MNLEKKQAIATALRTYLNEHGLNQAEAAHICGVSEEYLTKILKPNSDFTYNAGKGKIGLIPDKWFYNIAEVVGLSCEKNYWQIQPTAQMAEILSVLQDAKQFGYTNLIIGETGCGKSYVSDLFAYKNPTDVYILKIRQSDNLGDIIDGLLDMFKLSHGKTKSKKLRDISHFLDIRRKEGHEPTVIFDESEFMTLPTLCAMKELTDSLKGKAAVVLVGTSQLLDKLDKMRKKDKAGIPQFYRRIKFGIRRVSAINKDFETFICDIEDKELRQFITKNCENYGELHDLIVPVRREADRLNVPIDFNLVRKVHNLPNF